MSMLIKLNRSISRQLTIQFRQIRQFSNVDEGEAKIVSVLKEKFPLAKDIQVQDISGGCGSMYHISIESKEFSGIRKVKQHMMVNEALKKEIQAMHGLRIETFVPEE